MASQTTTVETYDGNGNLIGSRTVTWTTTPEQDNDTTIRQQALTALTSNRTFINATKPSTAAAQASQAYDQAVALSRQNNGVIRLLLGLLDGTN